MNNLQLYGLLDEIYKANFLESIELIQEKTPEYKKSDFFKKTKLPLETVYEKYFYYMNANYSFDEKVEQFVNGIDPEVLSDIFIKAVEYIQNNEEFMKKVESFVSSFDVENLQKQNDEIEKLTKNLK
jgi:hypothetical protein